MKPAVALVLVLALVAISGGCTLSRITAGVPLGPVAARDVAVGLGEAQVLERLGPPDAVSWVREGPVFEYAYSSGLGRNLSVSMFRASFTYDEVRARLDRLVVFFDRKGVVRDHAVVRQTEPAPEAAASD